MTHIKEVFADIGVLEDILFDLYHDAKEHPGDAVYVDLGEMLPYQLEIYENDINEIETNVLPWLKEHVEFPQTLKSFQMQKVRMCATDEEPIRYKIMFAMAFENIE